MSTKLITAIMPKGSALKVLRVLKEEHGVVSSFIVNSSGVGREVMTSGSRSMFSGYSREQDILAVRVDAERSEEIFRVIFDLGEMDRPKGGFIFQQQLSQSTQYMLPEVLDEDDFEGA